MRVEKEYRLEMDCYPGKTLERRRGNSPFSAIKLFPVPEPWRNLKP